MNDMPAYYILKEFEAEYYKIKEINRKKSTDISRNYFFTEAPYEFLMSEDENWVLRAWYAINLKDSANGYLDKYILYGHFEDQKDGKYEFKKEVRYQVSLIDSLLKEIDKPYSQRRVSAYADDGFFNRLDSGVQAGLKKNDVDKLQLKIDWNYDKKTGTFNSHIIGLGLVSGKKSVTYWLYYPEVKWLIENYQIWGLLQDCHNFDLYFRQHYYDATLLNYELLSDSWYCNFKRYAHNHYYNDRTELEALFMIELLKDRLRYKKLPYSGEFKISVDGSEYISGKQTAGFFDGKMTWFFQDGSKKLECEFRPGVLNGSFTAWYKNGKLKEKGSFITGKKDGKWLSYASNGKLIADRNFSGGWMEGKQFTWYENGEKHLEFNYVNHIINGDFCSWYENGLVISKGRMTKGLKTGEWEYNLQVSDSLKEFINAEENAFELLKRAAADNVVSLKVAYSHRPVPYFRGLATEKKIIENIH